MPADTPIELPCGHVALASHYSGDRLWVCGCLELVDEKDPDAGTKPVRWALLARPVNTVTYSASKL